MPWIILIPGQIWLTLFKLFEAWPRLSTIYPHFF